MNLINPVSAVSPPQLTNGINEVTRFTANGNFTPLVSALYLCEVQGPGGGGGGGATVPAATVGMGAGGEGGGCGDFITSVQLLTAGTPYAIILTGGGAGGAAGNPGVTGGQTNCNFPVHVIAGGGPGGQAGIARFAALTSDNSLAGGNGGGSGGGRGGAPVTGQNPGNDGTAPLTANSGAGGGGGSGGANQAGTTLATGGAGQAGSLGYVLIQRA